jgi:hypothetical protein
VATTAFGESRSLDPEQFRCLRQPNKIELQSHRRKLARLVRAFAFSASLTLPMSK